MKRISLDDLLHTRQDLDYQEQYEYIMKLLEKGQIKPVKASKSNGKKPALYREYWIVEEQKDYSNSIRTDILHGRCSYLTGNMRNILCAIPYPLPT